MIPVEPNFTQKWYISQCPVSIKTYRQMARPGWACNTEWTSPGVRKLSSLMGFNWYSSTRYAVETSKAEFGYFKAGTHHNWPRKDLHDGRTLFRIFPHFCLSMYLHLVLSKWTQLDFFWASSSLSNLRARKIYWAKIHLDWHMGMGQNLVPLVNIKIAGKWMFIPLKMVLIGIDPYPHIETIIHQHVQRLRLKDTLIVVTTISSNFFKLLYTKYYFLATKYEEIYESPKRCLAGLGSAPSAILWMPFILHRWDDETEGYPLLYIHTYIYTYTYIYISYL